jgi:hypothetical protein
MDIFDILEFIAIAVLFLLAERHGRRLERLEDKR